MGTAIYSQLERIGALTSDVVVNQDWATSSVANKLLLVTENFFIDLTIHHQKLEAEVNDFVTSDECASEENVLKLLLNLVA